MTESRKLVTIRRVAEIRCIEGADAIECVVVDSNACFDQVITNPSMHN